MFANWINLSSSNQELFQSFWHICSGRGLGNVGRMLRCPANSEDEQTVLGDQVGFLLKVEKAITSKSLEMLVLLAMLKDGKFPGVISLNRVTERIHQFISGNESLGGEIDRKILDDRIELFTHVMRNPINAWVGGNRKSKNVESFFEITDGMLRSKYSVGNSLAAIYRDMVREIVDWRIAEYLSRPSVSSSADSAEFVCRVIQSNGRSIIKLPSRLKHTYVPEGETKFKVSSKTYTAKFAKQFLNVIRNAEGKNVLANLVVEMFGENAGQPGTRFQVRFVKAKDLSLIHI